LQGIAGLPNLAGLPGGLPNLAGLPSIPDVGNLDDPAAMERAIQAMAAAMTDEQKLAIRQATQDMASVVHGQLGGEMAQQLAPPAEAQQSAEEMAEAASMMQHAQAQYLVQQQFQAEFRAYENLKNMASGEMPARFPGGFRPMQMCRQRMKTGTCKGEQLCRNAHSIEELHPLSPELPGNEARALMEQQPQAEEPEAQKPIMRMQRKRAMCKNLQEGACLLSDKCPFAHLESELGTVSLVIVDRVKTRLCKHWEVGKCIYGKHCVNAHGMEQIGLLRPEYVIPPSKRQKTEDGEDIDIGKGAGKGSGGKGFGGKGKH